MANHIADESIELDSRRDDGESELLCGTQDGGSPAFNTENFLGVYEFSQLRPIF
jgi:hypothetical protein